MRKLMVSFILACVLLSGVSAAFAAVAGDLVSNNSNSWLLWVNGNQSTFSVRTSFLGPNIDDFADQGSDWTSAVFEVSASNPIFSGDLSLDRTSGVRLERASYNNFREVVYTYSLRPLLKQDRSLWTSPTYPNGYTPTIEDLLFKEVIFRPRSGGAPSVETFSPLPFVLSRIPRSASDGSDTNIVQPAGQLISNNANDWRAWANRDGDRFIVQTAFKGNINEYANSSNVWTQARFAVLFDDNNLNRFSGVTMERAEYKSEGRQVVYTFSTRPLRNLDGTLWKPESHPQGYTPKLNDLFFVDVIFMRLNGSLITEEFTPSPIFFNRIPPTETSGNSGGCSAGAFAPFVGALMLPLLALVRRKQ